MTILSAQSIRGLCTPQKIILHDNTTELFAHIRGKRSISDHDRMYLKAPLITPFVERGVVNGKSFGLSACSYDCRISDNLIVPVGQSRLAATIERFCIPANICGSVLDKSSWARVFLTAFNTHLDPGWEGYLTVELANLGTEVVRFAPGDPLCQVKFEWLDEATDLPYSGKYSGQGPAPQPAIQEE